MIRRLKQTYRHLAVLPNEELAGGLPATHLAFLEQMSRPDRRHALATYARLRAARADDELCAVGLLHDVGKPCEVRLWQRVAAVLTPALARRFGDATLRAYLDHAQRGARIARELGLSERAIRLIAEHHALPGGEDARVLALADRE